MSCQVDCRLYLRFAGKTKEKKREKGRGQPVRYAVTERAKGNAAAPIDQQSAPYSGDFVNAFGPNA